MGSGSPIGGLPRTLREEGAPGPRGGHWTASLILGNAERETGILRNRSYIGQSVWNRQRFLKDPTTGKRVARPNPREEWVLQDVPHLRIIDDELWAAAQTRLAANRAEVVAPPSPINANGESEVVPSTVGKRLGRTHRPAWPLSGLVKCGLCDGNLSVMGKDRIGCANHHARGTCTNNRTILRTKLQAKVLDGLKHRLLAPEFVAHFVKTYIEDVKAANQERGARRHKVHAEHARVTRQINAVVETIRDTGGSRSLVEDVKALERRQDELADQLTRDAQPEELIELHPNLPELYRRRVEALEVALQDPEGAALAAQALRSLIDAIVLYPEEGRGQYWLELRGDLAAFRNHPA